MKISMTQLNEFVQAGNDLQRVFPKNGTHDGLIDGLQALTPTSSLALMKAVQCCIRTARMFGDITLEIKPIGDDNERN